MHCSIRIWQGTLTEGRGSVVYLLIKIGCSERKKNIFFFVKISSFELVRTRRSTILIIPSAPAFKLLYKNICKNI
jgi:hypothetical protein